MNTVSDYFGSQVFDDRVMKARLPYNVYTSLKKTIDEGASAESRDRQCCGRRDEGLGRRTRRHPFHPLVPAA